MRLRFRVPRRFGRGRCRRVIVVGDFELLGAPAGSELGVRTRAWVCCSSIIGRGVWLSFWGIVCSLGGTVVALIGILNLNLGRLVSPAGSRVTLGTARLSHSLWSLGATILRRCCWFGCSGIIASIGSAKLTLGHFAVRLGFVPPTLGDAVPPSFSATLGANGCCGCCFCWCIGSCGARV